MLDSFRARIARAFTPPEDELGSISLEDLRRALKSIEGKYNGFRDENRRLKAVVQELRDQIDRVEQELGDTVQQREDSTRARDDLADRLARAEAERDELSARIRELERELAAATALVAGPESAQPLEMRPDGQAAVDSSSVESPAQDPSVDERALQERLLTLEAERDEQRAQLDELGRLLEAARSRVEVLEAEVSTMPDRSGSSQDPVEPLTSREQEDEPVATAAFADGEREEWESRVAELEAECERLRNKLAALADAASLEDQLEETSSPSGWEDERSELLARLEVAEASREGLAAHIASLEADRAELQATLDELIYSPSVPARPEVSPPPVAPSAPAPQIGASAAEVADLKDTIRYLEEELSGIAGEFESVRDQYVSERDVHRKLRKEYEELQTVVEEYRTQGVPDPEEVQQLRLSTQEAQDQSRRALAERDDWRARFEQADAALELTQDALSVSQATQAELLDLKSALEQQLAQERELASRLEARIKSMESSFQARAAELSRDRGQVRGGAGSVAAPRPPISDARSSAIDRAVSAAALAAASAAATAASTSATAATSAGPSDADKTEKDRLARLESEVAMLLAALKKQASAEVGAVAVPQVEPSEVVPVPLVEPVRPGSVAGIEPVAVDVADSTPLPELVRGETFAPEPPAPAPLEVPASAEVTGEDAQAARRRALRQMLQGGGR